MAFYLEPDRDIYLDLPRFRRQGTYSFIVSRGCPYQCSFCFVHQWKELYRGDRQCGKIRLRSVDRCLEEIRALCRKVEVKQVLFADSTFNVDRQWTVELMQRYGQEIGLPFTLNLRANLVDEAVAGAIAATGCCRNIVAAVQASLMPGKMIRALAL